MVDEARGLGRRRQLKPAIAVFNRGKVCLSFVPAHLEQFDLLSCRVLIFATLHADEDDLAKRLEQLIGETKAERSLVPAAPVTCQRLITQNILRNDENVNAAVHKFGCDLLGEQHFVPHPFTIVIAPLTPIVRRVIQHDRRRIFFPTHRIERGGQHSIDHARRFLGARVGQLHAPRFFRCSTDLIDEGAQRLAFPHAWIGVAHQAVAGPQPRRDHLHHLKRGGIVEQLALSFLSCHSGLSFRQISNSKKNKLQILSLKFVI